MHDLSVILQKIFMQTCPVTKMRFRIEFNYILVGKASNVLDFPLEELYQIMEKEN